MKWASMVLLLVAVIAFDSRSVPNSADQAGLDVAAPSVTPPTIVTYTGNRFSRLGADQIFTLVTPSGGGPQLLTALKFLEPGDGLEISDIEAVDFDAGVPFHRVVRQKDGYEGYITRETLLGETFPATLLPDPAAPQDAPPEIIPFDEGYLIPVVNIAPEAVDRYSQQIAAGDYLTRFSADGGATVHPVLVGASALSVLLHAMTPGCDEACRTTATEAGSVLFERYAFPEADALNSGTAWPYQFEWPLAWGITLQPPWYSGYANSVMALNAAIMFELTGDRRYNALSKDAVRWLLTPMTEGGALYEVDGAPFIAEYVYSVGLPNVRVFDGEFITLICLFNIAVIERNSALLARLGELVTALTSALPLMESDAGYIVNARYPWVIDDPGYLNLMKQWAGQIFAIGKQSEFLAAADRWKLAPSVWP